MKTYIHIRMRIPNRILLRIWNITGKVAERIKTHISGSINFFRKFCLLCGKEEEPYRCWQDTDADIIQRITCNIYCFSMSTMRTRTHINVTVYVYRLSAFSLPLSPVLSVAPVAGSTFQFNIWAHCGTSIARSAGQMCGFNRVKFDMFFESFVKLYKNRNLLEARLLVLLLLVP
jgi:hypothetical protein